VGPAEWSVDRLVLPAVEEVAVHRLNSTAWSAVRVVRPAVLCQTLPPPTADLLVIFAGSHHRDPARPAHPSPLDLDHQMALVAQVDQEDQARVVGQMDHRAHHTAALPDHHISSWGHQDRMGLDHTVHL